MAVVFSAMSVLSGSFPRTKPPRNSKAPRIVPGLLCENDRLLGSICHRLSSKLNVVPLPISLLTSILAP